MQDRQPPDEPGSQRRARRIYAPPRRPGDDSEIDTVVDYSLKQRRQSRERVQAETVPNTDLPPIGQVDAVASARSAIVATQTTGRPSILLLVGESGAGKTQLLEYTEALAAKLVPGIRVVWGSRQKREGGSRALSEEMVRGLRDRGADPNASGLPAIVLLDDFHLASAEDWELLSEISRAETPTMIVLTGDPSLIEQVSQLGFSGEVVVRSIEPLDEHGISIIVESVIPNLQGDLEPLVSALTHRSRGNPRAARELMVSLLKTELFIHTKTGINVDIPRLASGGLALTMEDAVYGRLRRLDPFEKATLERAAIIGETFWDGGILSQMRCEDEALAQQNGKNTDPMLLAESRDFEVLKSALGRLEAKGIIERVEDAELATVTQYRFCYPAMKSLVYSHADESVRAKRHSAVAGWLQVVCQGQSDFAARLATHLEKGGHKTVAGRAHLEAAMYERARLRTVIALRHCEKALALIPQSEIVFRLDTFHEWGAILSTLGRLDEALEAFHRMFLLAWRIGSGGRAGAALNRIARVHRDRGDNRKAQSFFERALELFRNAGDLRGVAATLDDLGQIQLLLGNTQVAIASSTEALDIRRAHSDRRGEAVSLTTLGSIELSRGNLDQAESMLQKAFELRQEINDYDGLVQSGTTLGLLASDRGDLDGAVRHWRAALERAREMASRRSECFLLNYLGEVLTGRGRYDEAADCLEKARRMAEKLGDRRALAEVQRNVGVFAIRRGDTTASQALERAKELAEAYGSSDSIARCYLALGQLKGQTLYHEGGSVDRSAEEIFLESMRLFRESGNEKGVARSLAALGYHLVERGDLKSAKVRLREARSLMRRMGLGELQRIEQVLGEIQ